MTNLEKNGKRYDQEFMRAAIAEAGLAAAKGEVPIGAVAVVEGQVVARAHNLREATGDPLGHAEVLLLQKLVENVTPASEPGSSTMDSRVRGNDEYRIPPQPLDHQNDAWSSR